MMFYFTYLLLFYTSAIRKGPSPTQTHDTDTDTDSVTPTNVPMSPPIFIPKSELPAKLKYTQLSPISGSFDLDSHSEDSPYRQLKSPGSVDDDSEITFHSSTNELPLTELNLKLFTSGQNFDSTKMSTNELPLSDISFKKFSVDGGIPDDTSLEVNWESENSEVDTKEYREVKREKVEKVKEKWPQHRSFSDPNILESEKINKYFLLEKLNKVFDESKDSSNRLSVAEPPAIPFSFYTTTDVDVTNVYYARNPSTLLSFFSSPPNRLTTSRSFSQPSPDITGPSMSNSDNGANGPRRHRHSIAGQMSYFKMLGFGFGGPVAFKKLTGATANSLFSTAVISGSSSAPNLRDMIPSSASATGEYFGKICLWFQAAFRVFMHDVCALRLGDVLANMLELQII